MSSRACKLWKLEKKISHVQSDESKYSFITVCEVQVQSQEFKTRFRSVFRPVNLFRLLCIRSDRPYDCRPQWPSRCYQESVSLLRKMKQDSAEKPRDTTFSVIDKRPSSVIRKKSPNKMANFTSRMPKRTERHTHVDLDVDVDVA